MPTQEDYVNLLVFIVVAGIIFICLLKLGQVIL